MDERVGHISPDLTSFVPKIEAGIAIMHKRGQNMNILRVKLEVRQYAPPTLTACDEKEEQVDDD